jgi:hypothetical protein
MTQTRIVLNPKYKDKAQEILEVTGIDSLSQLFTLLLANYGDVLVRSLKQIPQVAPVTPQPPLPAPQAPAIKPQESPKPKQFTPLSSF